MKEKYTRVFRCGFRIKPSSKGATSRPKVAEAVKWNHENEMSCLQPGSGSFRVLVHTLMHSPTLNLNSLIVVMKYVLGWQLAIYMTTQKECNGCSRDIFRTV